MLFELLLVSIAIAASDGDKLSRESKRDAFQVWESRDNGSFRKWLRSGLGTTRVVVLPLHAIASHRTWLHDITIEMQ